MLDVDIVVQRGSFVGRFATRVAGPAAGVIGSSGAGKTTLIRALAGLDTPVSGRIALFDKVLFDSVRAINMPPYKRGLGVVFQDTRLFPHLTVRGNLAYGQPRPRSVASRQALERLANELGLTPLLDRRVGSLSGGEAKRAALARAALQQPRLLLLDEPLAGSDREARATVLSFLHRLARKDGLPFVCVSHLVDELTTVVTEMVCIHNGRCEGRVAAASSA